MWYVPTMTMPQNEQMTLEFVGLIASVILITGRNLGNHFRAQSGYLFFFPISYSVTYFVSSVWRFTSYSE